MRNSKPVFIRGRNKSSAIFLASIITLLVGLATRAPDGRAQDVEPCYRNRTASQWMESLRTADAAGRSEAAYCLGQMKAEAAVPLLQTVAQKDPDHFVRAEAVYALGNIPARSALPLLAQLLKQDPMTGVRGAASLPAFAVRCGSFKSRIGAAADSR